VKKFEEVFERAVGEKRVVAVAAAADFHVLEAVAAAVDRGIAEFVLFGDEERIREIAGEVGLKKFEVVAENDDVKACGKAVRFVAEGKADAIMKGIVETGTIMKAVLDKEAGMRTGRKLSHLAAFELGTYHKLLFVTDAAINIAPDLEGKKEILANAAAAMGNLGIEKPLIALLAAKEKADDKMPVTLEYVDIVAEHKRGFLAEAVLDGPLALDNAISAESCEIKGIVSPVGGDADLLFCPNIEVGNVLYKSLAFLAGAKNGGVVVGAKRPIILTSRADSAESKLISIALSVLF